MKKLILFLFCAMLACADKGEPNKPKIISDRFQEEKTEFEEEPLFIALLELKKNPALLVTADRVDGVTKLNPTNVEALLKEQEEMIKEIKTISSDIEILYTYRMVLNALAIISPQKYADNLSQLDVHFIEPDERFASPSALTSAEKEATSLALKNSVTFIGVDKVHRITSMNEFGVVQSLTGHGVRIGVVDTGIDYTHRALGGSGSVSEYEAINPNEPSNLFPNQKVVGGRDFVGEGFNALSRKFNDSIPRPDDNPIDLSGHGSHVAATLAGVGDGVNTHVGVAPDAQIFALKVFGDKGGGGTSDTAIIAALEYAADPNGDLDPMDQLDVLNLSLGSGYGKPHTLYNRAMTNLSRGGTLVVGAAGNYGALDNVISSPSSTSYAISVASGIDNLEHNWQFEASEFSSPSTPSILVYIVSGPVSSPVEEFDGVASSLVFVGEAKETDVTEELKAQLVGRVALIDRGSISFYEKINRVKEAGAVGAVVVNNVPEELIRMSGDSAGLPAIMVTKEIGDRVKGLMQQEEVTFTFKQPKKIERPELIDTLSPGSSKGPRMLDSLLKPEITAPGVGIISARAGTGHKSVTWSGTSMAAPHVAGVLGLLRQRYPQMEPWDLKAMVMNTAKSISDEEGKEYPVSRQGSGRIQAFKAVTSPIVVQEAITSENPEGRADLSLGEVSVERTKTLSRTLEVKNHSNSDETYSVSYVGSPALSMNLPSSVTVEAGQSLQIPINVTIDGTVGDEIELDGFVLFKQEDHIQVQVPVLAVISRVSNVVSEGLRVFALSLRDSVGANVEMGLVNKGIHAGQAYLFNKLGLDARKPERNPSTGRNCDLESVGYRVVEKKRGSFSARFFQTSIKLFKPVTDWQPCYVIVEIDANGDGEAEQVIRGTHGMYIAGVAEVFPTLQRNHASFHLDVKKMKEQREKVSEDQPLTYVPALVTNSQGLSGINEFVGYKHSTLAIVEAKVNDLPRTVDGQLAFRVTVHHIGLHRQEVDGLGKGVGGWVTVSPERGAYLGMPNLISLRAGESQRVKMRKGLEQTGELLLLTPQNAYTFEETGRDYQLDIVSPVFEVVQQPM